MQGPHHVSPIKNWKQLVVVIVLAFAVPIAVIVLLSQYVTDVSVPAGADVLERIKPVGEVVVQPAGGAAAPSAAAASPATAASSPAPGAPKAQAQAPSTSGGAAATTTAAPAAAKPDGKKVYDATCTACHTPGVAGAPKLGDKAAWAPRLKEGMDAVYAIALKGKGAMPAKGGNASLSDAEVRAAVDYMVSAVK